MMSAQLKLCMLNMPDPPSAIDLAIFLHLTRWILPFESFPEEIKKIRNHIDPMADFHRL